MQVEINVANTLIGSKKDAFNIITNIMGFFMRDVKSKGFTK
jgi:hypothetical protein